MEFMMWSFGWLEGLIALLMMIAFWSVVIMVIVKLVRSTPVSIDAPGSGLRVLEERYARGEIGREEFLERRAVLSGNEPPPARA